MSGWVLSGLQQYCSLEAVTSGPAHAILSKASQAAAPLFSLPYPAELQSGWLCLCIRNMWLKRWQYCEWLTVTRPPTRTWFTACCFAFLFGDKPVHLIQHSVNLWHDQQLQCKKKSEWWRWRWKGHCCHCFCKHSPLLWLQSLCWRWQSDTVCPPPHPDHTHKKWNNWQMKTSLSENLWDAISIAVSVCTGSMSPSSLWMSWQSSINMFIGFVKAK